MRVPKYVSESPELLAARAWEESTRWKTRREADAELLDRSKDWRNPLTGERFGVPEIFCHCYDSEVAA